MTKCMALRILATECKQKMSTDSLSLEELYGIEKGQEFRKTLRKIKEKEQLILKLRESCLDLVIKFADAQNTIDELRFYQPAGVVVTRVPPPIKSIDYLEKVATWKTEEECKEGRRLSDELEDVLSLARRVRDKAIHLNLLLTPKVP